MNRQLLTLTNLHDLAKSESPPAGVAEVGIVDEKTSRTDLRFSISNCEEFFSIPFELIRAVRVLERQQCGDHSHARVEITLQSPSSATAKLFQELLSIEPFWGPNGIGPSYCLCTVVLQNIDSGKTKTGVGDYVGRAGAQTIAARRAIGDASRGLNCVPRRCEIISGPNCDCSPEFASLPAPIDGAKLRETMAKGILQPPLSIKCFIEGSIGNDSFRIRTVTTRETIVLPADMIVAAESATQKVVVDGIQRTLLRIQLAEPADSEALVYYNLIRSRARIEEAIYKSISVQESTPHRDKHDGQCTCKKNVAASDPSFLTP
jgi:hypothetical protein